MTLDWSRWGRLRAQQEQAHLVRGDLLCNNVETRMQERQGFRDERGIADAKSHEPQ